MDNIIEIDIVDIHDFYETYNNNVVSDALIKYIINQVPDYKIMEKYLIKINSKIMVNVDIKKYIVDGLKDKYHKSYKNHFKNTLIQVIYLLIGILIIFVSTLIGGDVLREVILICGWVLIWATVELEIFSDIDGRKTRKKLKSLINSDFIVNKIE